MNPYDGSLDEWGNNPDSDRSNGARSAKRTGQRAANTGGQTGRFAASAPPRIASLVTSSNGRILIGTSVK
jgi:hypothetical protein